jgi:hypothetical protein
MLNSSRPHHLAWPLLALAGLLFALYAFLPLTAPPRDNSPDENANRFFSRVYWESGRLWVHEQYNFLAPGRIHPRSVAVQDQWLVPGGFIGLPAIYGGLGHVVGVAGQPYLTAFFATLALAAFGLAVGRVFSKSLGVTAAVLLALQPNWWYQMSRPFMPNGLLVALLLLAAGFYWGRPTGWLLGRFIDTQRHRLLQLLDPLLAGLMLGLALAVRPPAAYWVGLFVLVLAAYEWRSPAWAKWGAVGLGAIGSLLPFGLLHRSVYGSWLASGYGASPTAVNAAAGGGWGMKLLGPLQPYLFPLGFAPRTAFKHFLDFGLGLFAWWWLLLLAAALWWYLHRCRLARPRGRKAGSSAAAARLRLSLSRPAQALLVASLVVAVWLILFYGSWIVRDNPDPAAVTIGSSYLRYWLPLYILSVLPLAWAIDHIRLLCGRRCPLVPGALLGLVALLSAATVFMSPQEGLWTVQQNLFRSDYLARRVVALTEPRSLVVVDRADKFIFPDRTVTYPLRDEATYDLLAHLTPRLGQIYYFGITLPQSDLKWLQREKLPPLGLTIDPIANFGAQSLYRFRPAN